MVSPKSHSFGLAPTPPLFARTLEFHFFMRRLGITDLHVLRHDIVQAQRVAAYWQDDQSSQKYGLCRGQLSLYKPISIYKYP